MKKFSVLVSALLLSSASGISSAYAEDSNWVSDWLDQVTEIQSEQPHWVTPLVTVTPRLEQEFRTDFVGQQNSTSHETYIFGNGKGLELIPFHLPIEVLINVPPYIEHNTKKQDGFGDFSFLFKYRILSANAKDGDYILTAFLGMSAPTGTASNGTITSIFTPTIAGGKGCGPVDVQSTLGITIPANNATTLGHRLLWNTTLQYHFADFLWPEIEDNSTWYLGGEYGGKNQNFVTPGVMLGRFKIHERVGFTIGGGYQIATTNFNLYNHSWIVSMRLPF